MPAIIVTIKIYATRRNDMPVDIDNKPKHFNCKFCGAPNQVDVCEYCGCAYEED